MTELAMRVILMMAVLAVGISLFHFHRSGRWQQFCLLDLLMENGRISKFSCILMGAFLMTTWVIVYLAAAGKLTEGYFGLYIGAWITPSVAKLLKGTTPPAAELDQEKKPA